MKMVMNSISDTGRKELAPGAKMGLLAAPLEEARAHGMAGFLNGFMKINGIRSAAQASMSLLKKESKKPNKN
jgi:hypothetical protein